MLHDMSASEAGKARFTYGHHVALQFVIEKQRVELFRLVATCPEFSVSCVNLTRLFYLAEDKYSVIHADTGLKKRMKQQLKAISETTRARTPGRNPAAFMSADGGGERGGREKQVERWGGG